MVQWDQVKIFRCQENGHYVIVLHVLNFSCLAVTSSCSCETIHLCYDQKQVTHSETMNKTDVLEQAKHCLWSGVLLLLGSLAPSQTRPWADFKVLGAKYIFRGKIFGFNICFNKKFSGDNKIWGHCPRMHPMAVDLSQSGPCNLSHGSPLGRPFSMVTDLCRLLLSNFYQSRMSGCCFEGFGCCRFIDWPARVKHTARHGKMMSGGKSG